MNYLIVLTFLILPAYAFRFNLGPIPTNLLMVWSGLILILGGVLLTTKNSWSKFIDYWRKKNKIYLWLVFLFLLAGVISLLVKGTDTKKTAQFLVLFLEPIGIFFLFGYYFNQNEKSKSWFVSSVYVLLAAMGIFSAIQYFTLFGLPILYQGNLEEPKRALGFFSHPNFYALFIAPLLVFLLPDLVDKIRQPKKNLFFLLGWLLGAVGLLLSLSRAGWAGLVAAIIIFLLLIKNKKIKELAKVLMVAATIIIFLIPSFRHRITGALSGNEKSADSRVELWQSGIAAIKTSPIFGLGLNGYSNRYWEFQTDKTLDTHNFPHNIFLDAWVETGLLGLFSFAGILIYGLITGFKNKQNIFAFGMALFLLTFIIQGQVDNPYFKNDLAMVFWMIMAIGI